MYTDYEIICRVCPLSSRIPFLKPRIPLGRFRTTFGRKSSSLTLRRQTYPLSSFATRSSVGAIPTLKHLGISWNANPHESTSPLYQVKSSPTASRTTSSSRGGKDYSASWKLWPVIHCCRRGVKSCADFCRVSKDFFRYALPVVIRAYADA